jgi:FMN-dependent NADH-azoreductase
MKVLHVDSSILSGNSVSRGLTADVVDAIRNHHGDTVVTYRDLARDPVDHLSGAHLAADQISDVDAGLRRDIEAGQQRLDEFLAADVVVVGAPMYNFGIPSQLKAWIDRLAVAGKTFRYTEQGVQGLAGGKKVVIVSSRGGYYGADTPMAALDHQETYLKGIFGFFGITDIQFVRAEGLAVGDTHRAEALATAQAAIAEMAAA